MDDERKMSLNQLGKDYEKEVGVYADEESLTKTNVDKVMQESERSEDHSKKSQQRRFVILLLLIGLLLVVGVVVALAVVLTRSDDDDESTPTQVQDIHVLQHDPATPEPTTKSMTPELTTAEPTTSPPSTSPPTKTPPTTTFKTPITISVIINLDSRPSETGWTLQCASQGTLFEADPGYYDEDQNWDVLSRLFNISIGDECNITLIDTGGNGITGGYFKVIYGTDPLNAAALITEGGSFFGSMITSTFTVEEPSFTTWTQVGKDIDGDDANDWSGFSVSISKPGDLLIVGAPRGVPTTYFSDSPNPDLPGTAKIYHNDESSEDWQQMQTLDGEDKGDSFGYAVSISGDGTSVVVGAPRHDNSTGAAYVYRYEHTSDEWAQTGSFYGEGVSDEFGSAVALSNDGAVVIIGAKNNDNNGNENSGRVYLYKTGPDDIYQLEKTFDGDSEYNRFGRSVAVSDDGYVFAGGAPGYGGYAQIFKYDPPSGQWIPYGDNHKILGDQEDSDGFGDAISLSSEGNVVAIGAPYYGYDSDYGWSKGTVRIYKYNSVSEKWKQKGSIDGEHRDCESGYFQGVALSGDGSIVAIGSYQNDDNKGMAGSTRIFEDEPNVKEWKQISQDIDGERKRDFSGYSVSLSGDGTVVATGSPFNDGLDAPTNDKENKDTGFNCGHVRVYRNGP